MPDVKPRTGIWGRLTGRGAETVPEPEPETSPDGAVRNGVRVDDAFAEAFTMNATALIVTAPTIEWARIAALSMTGFATSVIGCGCEAGVDRELTAAETPDGRPGLRVLIFAMSPADLQKHAVDRVGQCVLTCAGTACYSGLGAEQTLKLGANLRYFGDGHQSSKLIGGKRYWRVPVMDGEFVCEATAGVTSEAVGGGNLLILGRADAETLSAAETAVKAMRGVPDTILPFPGGVVRSGSKVGSKYAFMSASTNEAYCPTLRAVTDSKLDASVGSVLEIVIDGLTSDAVTEAMRTGLNALIETGARGGVLAVSAGNYGGKLGAHHFHLRELLA